MNRSKLAKVVPKTFFISLLIIICLFSAHVFAFNESKSSSRSALIEIACPFQNTLKDVNITCLKAFVHEDHNNFSSRIIAFHVVKFSPLRDRHSQAEGLLNIPVFDFGGGGPGGDSGFSNGELPLAYDYYKRFSTDQGRDLYLLEVRGTGLAEPQISCEKYKQSIAQYWLNRPQEVKTESLHEFTQCIKDLRALDVDLSNYNSYQIARDAEFVRKSLNIQSMHLVGVSYSTRYAQRYAQLYPSRTSSIVLDSPVFSNMHTSERADLTFRAINLLLKQISQRFGQQAKDTFSEKLLKWIDKLNDKPINIEITWPEFADHYVKDVIPTKTTLKVEADKSHIASYQRRDIAYDSNLMSTDKSISRSVFIDGEDLINILFEIMYYPDSDIAASIIIGELETQEYDVLSLVVENTVSLSLDNSFSDLLYSSTLCYEDLPFADLTKFDEGIKSLPAKFQKMAKMELLELLEECHIIYQAENPEMSVVNQKVTSLINKNYELLEADKAKTLSLNGIRSLLRYEYADKIESQPFVLNSPTLLLFGELDPVIPTDDILKIEANYKNGTVIEIPNTGHFSLQLRCIQNMVATFIENYQLNESEKSCLNILSLSDSAYIQDPDFLLVLPDDDSYQNGICIRGYYQVGCALLDNVKVTYRNDDIQINVSNADFIDGSFDDKLRHFILDYLAVEFSDYRCKESYEKVGLLQNLEIKCTELSWWQSIFKK